MSAEEHPCFPRVFLPLTCLELQMCSIATLRRSESSHVTFITKFNLVIKGNGALKVIDLEDEVFQCLYAEREKEWREAGEGY